MLSEETILGASMSFGPVRGKEQADAETFRALFPLFSYSLGHGGALDGRWILVHVAVKALNGGFCDL